MSSLAEWNIPRLNGTSAPLTLSPSETAIFVGANGTGKSALSHWLRKHVPHGASIVHIRAHRKLWLTSPGPDTTPSNYATYSSILAQEDLKPASRHKDARADQRSAGILFRLLSAENERNFRVSRLATGDSLPEELEPSPLDRITDLLQAAGLGLTFHVGKSMSFEVERQGHRYPIDQMSDGEKAAFLLATEVLLADANSVIILDEPERHLHRSISGRLIIQIVAERPDCAFVAFTHDLDLTDRLRHKSTSTTVVRSVKWNGPNPLGWDLEELPPQARLPDEARRVVLGGRERILFVEGAIASLDLPLYEHLFPGWSIQAGGSCREIIQMVSSLQRSPDLHWITAAGIVDGDARTRTEAEGLEKQGIFALPVNEVESLYFLPGIIRTMADWQARQLSLSADTLFGDAMRDGITKLASPRVQSHLAAANTEKILHRVIQSKSPSRSEIPNAGSSIELKVNSPYRDQLDVLEKAVEQCDWETLVTKYSVRDSPALDAISKALRYPDKSTYQQAVLGRLRDDADALKILRTVVSPPPPLLPLGTP